jgi:outer membrane lipoprotein-sorting protein
MNDQLNEYEFNKLESALEPAVQALLAESVPDDAVERVKACAKTLDGPVASPPLPGRAGMRRWARYCSLAAAVVLVVTAGLWFSEAPSTGRAFAEVIKNVQQVFSVEMTVKTRFGREPQRDGKMFLVENRMRMEEFDGALIIVCDLTQGKALYQDIHRKLYQLDAVGDDFAKRFTNPIEQIRHAKPDDAEHVGEEYVNGRLASVYRVPEVDLLGIRGRGEMLVWVDPANKLPVKIVIHDPHPKGETEIRFEGLQWNERLDGGLFALDPPEGYTEGKIVSIPTPRSVKELPEPAPVSPSQLARGILCEDRVPGRFVWGPRSATITAVMRDPESVPPQERMRSEMRQWNVATGELNWSIPASGAFALTGSPDDRWLATVEGYEIQLRDPGTGQVTRKWAIDKKLLALTFSPDGKTLAAGIAEWKQPTKGGVQTWDIEDGTLKNSWSEEDVTRFVRYSPDGRYLAGSSNSVKVWDAETGKLVRILPTGGTFGFSPDSKHIAAMVPHRDEPSQAGKRYDVRIYDVLTGKTVKTLVGEQDTEESWILWIEFSPDGRLLAAADWNGTATLWSVETGEVEKTITEHEGGVHVAMFSSDGKNLATASEDRTLRLWNVMELVAH